MEEDIKIIEEMIEVYRSCSVNEEGFDMKVDIGFTKKECEALESLLTRYKKLQEENEYLQYKLQDKISVEVLQELLRENESEV